MGAEQKGSTNTTPRDENIQPRKELDDAQKERAFSAALEFASELVEKKLDSTGLVKVDRDILVKYPTQSAKVKDYLKGVILGRLTDFHKKAVEANLLEADSISIFDDLRSVLCSKLSLCEDVIPDSVLNQLIDEKTDHYLGDQYSDEVRQNIPFIRSAAAIVIPDNRAIKPQSDREINQALLD